jgi:Rad3-related DNA helicase
MDGKTLAYLVPAILSGKRIVVATATARTIR